MVLCCAVVMVGGSLGVSSCAGTEVGASYTAAFGGAGQG